jgi:uncharacterized protein YuzE
MKKQDVLYISFGKPQPADEGKEVNDIIFRFKGNELVGITVIGFKHRLNRNDIKIAKFWLFLITFVFKTWHFLNDKCGMLVI